MWYLRKPQLFHAEKQEWESLGFVLNREIFSSKHEVQFSGCMEFEGEKYEFEVEYPSGYPYIHPRVRSKSTQYRKHQMPVEGELCLLEGWKDYGLVRCADLVPRMKLWLEGQKHGFNPETESEAPEPRFYHCLSDARGVLLTPKEVYGEWKGKDNVGIFQIHLRKVEDLLQGELVSITVGAGEDPIVSSQLHLPEGDGLVGYCVNVEEMPPYFENSQELLEWLEGQGFKKVKERCYTIKRKMEEQEKPSLQLGPLLGIRYIEDGEPHFLAVALSGRRKVDPWNEQVFNMVIFESEEISEERVFKRVASLRPLRDKHVLLIGAGAIGSQIALDLAKAGIGTLTLVDHERVSVGNIVRHSGNVQDVGKPKVDVVSEQAMYHNPYMKVFRSQCHLGYTPDHRVQTLLEGVHLIVCAVGHTPTERYIDEIARRDGIPVIYTYASGGAWSGRAFRVIPEKTGCYHCHQYHVEAGTLPPLRQPKTQEAIYEAGCVGPAFPGSGIDTGIIANLASRLSLQTLLLDHPDAYELSPYDHIVWYTQGGEGQLSHEQKEVYPYPNCPYCKLDEEGAKEGVTVEGRKLFNAMTNWEGRRFEEKMIPASEVQKHLEAGTVHPFVEGIIKAKRELRAVEREYKGRVYEGDEGRIVFERLHYKKDEDFREWEVQVRREGEEELFYMPFDDLFGFKLEENGWVPRLTRVAKEVNI